MRSPLRSCILFGGIVLASALVGCNEEPKKETPNMPYPSGPGGMTSPSSVPSEPVKDMKPADTKPADDKATDTKPSDAKPADVKPSDAKPADAKPSDTGPSLEAPATGKDAPKDK